jgi:hypothetical protein
MPPSVWHNIVVALQQSIKSTLPSSEIPLHHQGQGIISWRATLNDLLPDKPLPEIHSHAHDLLLDGHPIHHPMDLHAFLDADWVSAPKHNNNLQDAVSDSQVALLPKYQIPTHGCTNTYLR